LFPYLQTTYPNSFAIYHGTAGQLFDRAVIPAFILAGINNIVTIIISVAININGVILRPVPSYY